jgi:nicotinate-nucleotide adenylyltransferase
MKIGILGGSFNPPHQGHLHISKLAIKKLALNQLWWIPTLYNPHKKNYYESYQNRLNLCKQISKLEQKIIVKNYQQIYTIKLITRLQKKYPNYQFVWVMGADNFEKFHTWKNYQELIKSIPIAVFSRGYHLKKIRQSKAFNIYQNLKNSRYHNQIITDEIYLKKNFVDYCYDRQTISQNINASVDFNLQHKLIKNHDNFKINKFNNRKSLPKFLIYQTKLNDLSSTKIREIVLKK